MNFRFAGLALGLALIASPAAAAADWIAIPEPSDPWLFALGVVGLLLGRRAARKKPRPNRVPSVVRLLGGRRKIGGASSQRKAPLFV